MELKLTSEQAIDLQRGKSITVNGTTISLQNSLKEPLKNKQVKWDEFPKEVEGFYVDENCEVCRSKSPKGYDNNKDVFVTKEQCSASIALAQLSQWMLLRNDNWVPDWKANTLKYSIRYFNDQIDKTSSYHSQYFLSFKSEEIRDKFLEDFEYLIVQAKSLL